MPPLFTASPKHKRGTLHLNDKGEFLGKYQIVKLTREAENPTQSTKRNVS